MATRADANLAPPTGVAEEYPRENPVTEPVDTVGSADGEAVSRQVHDSLFDDVEALVDDVRTYVDTEVSFQKSRAKFVADRIKTAAIFGAGAGIVALIAAIALSIGLIIALTPLITAWGATAVVVLALGVVAYLLVRKARGAIEHMRRTLDTHAEGISDHE
ncbi:phage holin family protein [Aurantiacibacter spongiae]|uniref:Phage holin family protein n=1 Tax=Aurantiacibacter spongiae TaxID=2488860 RepID=A0A3N5DMK7_9SPHN|nr:phage holin family protein [Aurantiacibacter spongiae]RPF70231.1 phage holin family protein [Aurantiacibacter spongiae]